MCSWLLDVFAFASFLVCFFAFFLSWCFLHRLFENFFGWAEELGFLFRELPHIDAKLLLYAWVIHPHKSHQPVRSSTGVSSRRLTVPLYVAPVSSVASASRASRVMRLTYFPVLPSCRMGVSIRLSSGLGSYKSAIRFNQDIVGRGSAFPLPLLGFC